GACLRADRCSTGATLGIPARHTGLRFLRRNLPPTASTRQSRQRSALGRIFAQDGVSKEFPYWYTADRRPDYAFISEGQEHRIHVDAQRAIFAGGDFMFCLLRNAQMTLHGMLNQNTRRIDLVFPAQAIWAADIWGPDDKRPYPAPMVLLTTFFARRANDTRAFEEVVVPFLDRLTL